MVVYEMVVLIVLITVFGGIVRQYLKARDRARPEAELENERLKGEIGNLKDRIATLERLATDRRQLLADEIDALGRDSDKR
jgi:membrane protein implicated in regulation of membrane protease activity